MAKLPSDAELRKLFHLGWTDDELAAQYGVRKQAVNKRRIGMGLYQKPTATRVTEMVNEAWDVRTTSGGDSHHAQRPMQAMKYFVRQQLGDQLSPPQERRVQNLLDRMAREGEILDYNPETGIRFVPRAPEDGRRVMRWPEGKDLPSKELQAAMELPSPVGEG